MKRLAPGLCLLAGVVTTAHCAPRVARDGLVMNWSAKALRDAAVVGGPEPLRLETVTLDALFRADDAGGRGLQIIAGTMSAGATTGEGNPRQWVLEIRGHPPEKRGEFEGFLSFGVFGQDMRWHFALSDARLRNGWHHAVGTFDGDQLRLTLDGKLQRRFIDAPFGEYHGSINAPPDGVIQVPSAGGNSATNAHGLRGALEWLRIYDRALDDDEVRRHVRLARRRVPELREARDAAERPKPPYRVIFSNDTTNILSCISPYHHKGQPFSEEMIRETVNEVEGVDAHMLQPGLGWIPWWKSEEYPAPQHYLAWADETGNRPDPFGQYMIDGGDMVAVFIDQCRKRDQAPFVSLRLNDGHHLENVGTDHRLSVYCSKFYVDHPEYRIGPDMRSWDQHVHNWAEPEVREHKLAFIREICQNYDIDGFELDFMRHTSLFRLDETTFEERSRIITGFVAQVREVLDATANPGQRRWLCARVPCFLAAHDGLGIDLRDMVDAGLDMVNLSAYYFTQQQTDLPIIRELVPDAGVYLEMTHTTSVGPSRGGYDSFSYIRTTDEQFQTGAHLAYERGADGVSLFNFVYFREHGTPGRGPFNEPPLHVLPRLGQPEWLARQPQGYVVAETWNRPATPDRPFPKTFEAGDTLAVALDMAPLDATGDGVLRLMAKEDMSGCEWSVRMNGIELQAIAYVHKPIEHPYEAALGEPGQYACFSCDPGSVRDGLNRVDITLTSGDKATVRYLDVTMK